MAIVSEFEHDVYVSFRHSGNPMTPGGAAWAERVVTHLSMALRERTGRLVNIRLDRKPTLTRPERDRVEQRILHSALFIAILSPGFLGEERVVHEMETALSPNSMVRASLVVESLPIDDAEAAAAVADIPAMKFWEPDENGEPVALAPDTMRELFMTRVGQLADIVAGALAEIERVAQEEWAAPATPVAAPAPDPAPMPPPQPMPDPGPADAEAPPPAQPAPKPNPFAKPAPASLRPVTPGPQPLQPNGAAVAPGRRLAIRPSTLPQRQPEPAQPAPQPEPPLPLQPARAEQPAPQPAVDEANDATARRARMLGPRPIPGSEFATEPEPRTARIRKARPPARRRSPIVLIVVILLVLAAAVAAVWFFRQEIADALIDLIGPASADG